MNSNNKMYMTVEGPQREKQKAADFKSGRSNNLQVESSKEMKGVFQRGVSPYRVSMNRNKITSSIIQLDESKRNPSPSLSAVTTHEEYFREMEMTILSENQNLKQHNIFLKKQIQAMFERERKYKSNLSLNKQKMKQLESINNHLQQQFQVLINSIMREIERIQALIDEEKHFDSLLAHSNVDLTHKNSLASETESTINKDLEDLKSKVRDIYEKNFKNMEEVPVFHRSSYKSDSLQRYIDDDYPSEEKLHSPKVQIALIENPYEPDPELPASLINKQRTSRRSSKTKSKHIP